MPRGSMNRIVRTSRSRLRSIATDLVELLLILGEVDARPAVTEQVLDLRRRIGRIEADRDAAHGDRGEIEDHPFRTILGLDRYPITGLDAERQEREGGFLDRAPGRLPRELVPDPEVLVAHRDLPRCTLRPVAASEATVTAPVAPDAEVVLCSVSVM